ncbi:hypothetical protein B0T26DRAFT_654883 [Lasiosphaeria miniovina]|uniref:TauD/TfdA-like domain-containing protein n=1 Tax=Lasiosphaeria miniovina TaxID=1954250 RepID=A0AA39ZYR3_9PEZI|nr:uncharacterized protein B0T26DRAFT_654883 [Lasiosphaeria miniovina]KAK0706127.1 hypothetical protein B0T26DRAFT_654883 [Lasiosphaeria miniovina]
MSDAAMEFSGKDLEDIQRVAGLLNLTVDELIQQRRRAGEPSKKRDIPDNARIHHTAVSDTYSLSQLPGDGLRQDRPDAGPQPEVSHDADPMDLDLFEPEPSHSSSEPAEAEAAALPSSSTEVILLNPLWYDCNASVWGYAEAAGEDFPVDDISQLEDDGDESYVPVTTAHTGSDDGSHITARGKGKERESDELGTDWALVSTPKSLSSFQTPISATTGSIDKRYHPIAPRTSRHNSQSTEESSLRKVRKKRGRYIEAKKMDTNLTRSVHACVRCRMQRNRCVPDPTNPRGPCITCQRKMVRMSRLPCLRYMVTDSTLFRTDLNYMDFYKSHPMLGPNYGDFHLERQWTGTQPKFLRLGQVGAMNFQVELKEFLPPLNTTDVDLKGRPMYAVPWAIADPDAVVTAMTEYIDRGTTKYMYTYLDDTDGLVWDVFEAAYRYSVFPTPNRMLQKTLRLWVACRFLESKWRCWADNGWVDDSILAANPKDPFHDSESLPPYLDYQLASIIIHRILSPLRKEVLRELQATFNAHSPENWFVTFLTSFILLKNYETQMLFQKEFAERRQSDLFSKGFDWGALKVRKMARLDDEQMNFMAHCRDNVIKKGNQHPLSDMGVETVLPKGAGNAWGAPQLKTSTLSRVPNPQEWPEPMRGDLAWGPTSFASEHDYALTLNDDDVSEVRAALQHFNDLGLYGNEVSPSTFPLPTLGPRLLKAAIDVHRGKGFAVVRGIDPNAFSPEDNTLIFLGISSYIGAQRGRQDEDGNMLMHIRDAKLSKAPQSDRPTRYSARASTFHTDTFCDILALQTRVRAAEGGRNILSSSWTIFNNLMASRPDVVQLLAQPIWPFDSRGAFFECSTRPLLFYHGGRIIMNFAREPLLGLAGVRRSVGLAVLSQAQREALDVVENMASQSQIMLDAEPGDLLFINNHGVLHSREAFTDAPEAPSRYLVRMWLRNPTLAWKLPRALQGGSSRIYGDNELGEQWNIVDVPKVQFRLSERLTS